MAAIRGLVLLFLVFSLESAAAQGNPCPLTQKPQTPATRRLIPTTLIKTTVRPPQTTQKKPVTPAKKCPIGWKPFGGQCYRFFSQNVNWARAEKLCQVLGANLPSVRTKVRNNFLLSLVPGNARAWIGGHDGEVDGQWLWSNGARFDYSNWCRGEPNNHRRPENCLEINWTRNRCWNDESCLTAMGYICARKPR